MVQLANLDEADLSDRVGKVLMKRLCADGRACRASPENDSCLCTELAIELVEALR